MTVTAPPRGPELEPDRDLEQRVSDLEALIEEARRRARRRRQRIGAAALLTVAAGAAMFIAFGGHGGGGTGSAALAHAPGSRSSSAKTDAAPLAPLPPGTRVDSFAFDPRSPQTVYVITPGGLGGASPHVFKTIDGGAHWHATATSGRGWLGGNLALTADPRHSGTLYAGTGAAVYKTVDSGRNWTPSKRGLVVPRPTDRRGWVIALAIDPAHTNIVYASSDRVSKSSDGGHNWTTVFSPQRTSHCCGISALAIAPTRPEATYAIAVTNGRTSIFKSTDAGKTWHATTSVRGAQGGNDGYVTALAVDPRHPTTVYAALGANLLKTTNAGKTWHSIAHGLPIAANLSRGGCHCHNGVTDLAIDPRRTTTVYAAVEQGGIYKTTDGGQTWILVYTTNALPPPLRNTVAIDPSRPATIYAAGDSGTGDGSSRIFRSNDSGHTWAVATSTR